MTAESSKDSPGSDNGVQRIDEANQASAHENEIDELFDLLPDDTDAVEIVEPEDVLEDPADEVESDDTDTDEASEASADDTDTDEASEASADDTDTDEASEASADDTDTDIDEASADDTDAVDPDEWFDAQEASDTADEVADEASEAPADEVESDDTDAVEIVEPEDVLEDPADEVEFDDTEASEASADDTDGDFTDPMLAAAPAEIHQDFDETTSRRKWKVSKAQKVIMAAIAIAALVAAILIGINADDDGDTDGVEPVTTAVVDDVFSDLCEVGDVDMTAAGLPTYGVDYISWSANGLWTADEASDSDAATVQSAIVDHYFSSTGVGCTPAGLEYLRQIDPLRIDAGRVGLESIDAAGRIAFYGENPDEALVVARHIAEEMTDCQAELIMLSEADVQGGVYMLVFSDETFSDILWAQLPPQTALVDYNAGQPNSGLHVLHCTIGLG